MIVPAQTSHEPGRFADPVVCDHAVRVIAVTAEDLGERGVAFAERRRWHSHEICDCRSELPRTMTKRVLAGEHRSHRGNRPGCCRLYPFKSKCLLRPCA